MSSQQRSSKATLVWTILFVLGGIGLILNASLKPKGFGAVYVRDTPREFVQVSVTPPIGTDPSAASQEPVKKWVAADSPELSLPHVARTTADPIGWTQQTIVSPRDYWRSEANGFKGENGATYQFSLKYTIGVWVAAFFTLAILSFLWRDNPVYKFAESVVVGVSAAYWMVLAFWVTLVPKLFQPIIPATIKSWALPGTRGEHADYWWVALMPLALGVMLLLRLSRRLGWIAGWPIALVVGTTAALRLISHIQADFLAQISNSVVSLLVWTKGTDGAAPQFDWGSSLGNVVLIVSLLTVLVYFFFSVEHKGAVGKVARVGVWFLMISFGAAFAFTVMGRITLLSQRFEFLFDDWLWLIDPRDVHTFTEASTRVLQMLGVSG